MINNEKTMNNIGTIIADVVQKKFTPFKNPKNRGGSPRGVKEPPMFATRKIKKTITWTLLFLSLFARISGLISSMAAPVVPIQLANAVPIKIIPVFTIGVPTRAPLSCTPPEIVNRAKSNIINGTYSNNPTCSNSYNVIVKPTFKRKGTINNIAQNAEIFPKL